MGQFSTANLSIFEEAAATAVGAAGNTTAVSGWTDIAGGLYNIVTPANTAGPLVGAMQCAYTGTAFVGFQLIRPATETNAAFTRHVITMSQFTGEEIVCLRVNAAGTSYYGGSYGGNANGNARIFAFLAGGTTVLTNLTVVKAGVAGHVYELDLWVGGASPTTIIMNVYDVTLGRSLVAFGSAIDSTAGPQVNGSAGFCQFSAGSTTQVISSQSYQSAAIRFFSETGVVSSATTNTISCGVVAGGTAPYTYKLYRSLTANPTATDVLLQTVTTPTAYVDTPPDGRLYYYHYAINDSAGLNDVTTLIGAQLPTPYVICAIGDSITQGQHALGTGFDAVTKLGVRLTELLAPAIVTTSNQGVGGTASGDWLSGSTNLTNAITAFKAAATAAGAGAKVYVQYMLGTNDTKLGVTAATYAADVANTIAAIKAAGIANLAGIIIHNPPALGSPATGYYGFGEAGNLTLTQYATAIASIPDGVTVFAGDSTAYAYAIANPATAYCADNLHLSNLGYSNLASAWARTYAALLGRSGAIIPFSGTRFARRI